MMAVVDGMASSHPAREPEDPFSRFKRATFGPEDLYPAPVEAL